MAVIGSKRWLQYSAAFLYSETSWRTRRLNVIKSPYGVTLQSVITFMRIWCVCQRYSQYYICIHIIYYTVLYKKQTTYVLFGMQISHMYLFVNNIETCFNQSKTHTVVGVQDGSTPTLELCEDCHAKLKKHDAGDLSIAKGCDFGNPQRIGISAPTELERVILGCTRLYSSIVQLTAGIHKGRSLGKVLRGHFISFFQVRFTLRYVMMCLSCMICFNA